MKTSFVTLLVHVDSREAFNGYSFALLSSLSMVAASGTKFFRIDSEDPMTARAVFAVHFNDSRVAGQQNQECERRQRRPSQDCLLVVSAVVLLIVIYS